MRNKDIHYATHRLRALKVGKRIMRVLYLNAASGSCRWMDIDTIDNLGELAAMMKCTQREIEMTYIDREHVLFQCTNKPQQENRAFRLRNWDYCRVGGDACVARVDGKDIRADYEPFVRCRRQQRHLQKIPMPPVRSSRRRMPYTSILLPSLYQEDAEEETRRRGYSTSEESE